MALTTPWYKSSDLLDAIKRKILFPAQQSTFSDLDLLKFCNEEMFIAQVPSVLEYHEEYFATTKLIPLVDNQSRYKIPDRAIGLKLRDLLWVDENGDLNEMVRINSDDRAYFQSSNEISNGIAKYYIEGNDIVLSPGVSIVRPEISLVFVLYLRPNQLVKDDRAAIIDCFSQTIKINNAFVDPLDTVTINEIPYTAVNILGGTITGIAAGLSNITINAAAHQLSVGQTVIIAGSDSSPTINGSYIVKSVPNAGSFTIDAIVGVAGTTATFTSPNQFLIGASDILTAASLANTLAAFGDVTSANSNGTDTVTICYEELDTEILVSDEIAFIVPEDTIGIQFETLPTTYLDLETSQTTPLFEDGILIDLLQTRPGHKTYVYDVKIPNNGISGTLVTFNKADLLVPSSTSGTKTLTTELPHLVKGDYMCLANEAIIPQIPPDLHNGLAERAAARVLEALGDQQGLQSAMVKIQDIERRQGNLLDNRIDGSNQKVLNRNTLLRAGKRGYRGRF